MLLTLRMEGKVESRKHQAVKVYRASLEDGKVKEMDVLPEPPETQPFLHFDFSLVDPLQTSELQNCKINLYSFEPASL